MCLRSCFLWALLVAVPPSHLCFTLDNHHLAAEGAESSILRAYVCNVPGKGTPSEAFSTSPQEPAFSFSNPFIFPLRPLGSTFLTLFAKETKTPLEKKNNRREAKFLSLLFPSWLNYKLTQVICSQFICDLSCRLPGVNISFAPFREQHVVPAGCGGN